MLFFTGHQPQLSEETEKAILHDRRMAYQADFTLFGCLEDSLLSGQELADAFFGIIQHLAQLLACVGVLFCGSLGLDETAIGQHDYVHIYFSARVLFVTKVEQDMTIDDTNRGSSKHLPQGRSFEGSGSDQFVEGQCKGYAGSRDSSGASPPVGLKNIAVEDDGALAERLHIDDRTEAATDQALNLVGATADLAAFTLTCSAGEGGAGKHAILGGHPATPGVAQPAGYALFNGSIAEDASVAGLDQDRTLRHIDIVRSHADRAKGVSGAVVRPEELR